MNRRHTRNAGFSLTEVLMAAGILAMGFMMVLTLFPLGLKLTAKQTEATIGTLAAREAFINASLLLQSDTAKAGGVGAAYKDFDDIFGVDDYDARLFVYPSASNVPDEEKKYNTTLLVGNVSGDYAEAIVFSCRRVGEEARFPIDEVSDSDRPVVLSRAVTAVGDLLTFAGGVRPISSYLCFESEIVADNDGQIYKVVEIMAATWQVKLDRVVTETIETGTFDKIWFVPPAIGASKSAAVSVSRQSIRIR